MRRRVLVTDASRPSALSVIRSLGRAGFEVIAADPSPVTVGGASRYATAAGVYPSPFEGPVERTAAAIGEIACRHQVDLVVPVTDDVIVPLVAHPPELPDGCQMAMPGPDQLDVAGSKLATHELARTLGIDVPDSVVVRTSPPAPGIVERLGSPVAVKPDRSRRVGPDGRLVKGQVRYATSDAELAARVAEAGQPVLVQSFHPGSGVGIGLVLDDGRPLLAVQHRRLHEVPLSGGASALRETVPVDPVLLDQATALLGALRWTGAAMVEFKVGPSGTRLMEINGRLWGSLPLAVRAGADVPAVAAAVHLGDRADEMCWPDTSYASPVRARNLDLELVWIASVLRGRRSTIDTGLSRRDGLAAIAQLARRGQADDLFDDDDRGPARLGVRAAMAHLVRKVATHG